MPKTQRQKKIPLTSYRALHSTYTPTSASTSASASARLKSVDRKHTIHHYHTLVKQLDTLKAQQSQSQSQSAAVTATGAADADVDSDSADKNKQSKHQQHTSIAQQIHDIEQQIAALGGIEGYQHASIKGHTNSKHSAFN